MKYDINRNNVYLVIEKCVIVTSVIDNEMVHRSMTSQLIENIGAV